jgi:CubicO group peptidase (beta-lactamase class C family)
VTAAAGGLVAAMAPPPVAARRAATGFNTVVDPAELQALLDEAARSLGVVGAQLAVFDGRELHELATGLAVRERKLAVTTDTLFQIGSTTKVFNAAVIMALVDRGVLDLDRPVKTWITDFKLSDRDATERVTLRHLLSMSSGIDNGPYQDYGRGDDALDRYVAALAEIPHIFEPGTAFGYANAGSCVAGLAAERATSKTWEALLSDMVLGPLGLRQSATHAEDLLFHPVALGYSYRAGAKDPGLVRFWGLPRSMSPAGGTLCCSAGDLVRFARMFLAEGKAADGKQVISANGIRAMQTPQVTLPNRIMAQRWCPGPYWKQWGGQVIHGHSGTNSGGSSVLLWCPAKNVAIATIANVPRQGYPLADRIFDQVFPQVFKIEKPKAPTPETVQRVDVPLARYVGRFESYGGGFTFAEEGGQLIARQYSGSPGGSRPPTLTTPLIPLGDHRFLPVDPAMGGNRGWDVAFWGDDGQGRASHYLNGVFAMRRTG